MEFKWIESLLPLILLSVFCQCDNPNRIPLRNEAEATPSCQYSAPDSTIYCYYLQSTDMNLLAQALQETAQFVTSFSVSIQLCDGPSIPVDIFSGYNLLTFTSADNGYPEIPYELLSNIQSDMLGLYMWEDKGYASVEITSTELFLPFSDNLAVFQLSFSNKETVDLAAFMQYSNLSYLFLGQNNMNAVGLELLQLYKLQTFDISYNNVTTIETGAFRDASYLQELYLANNNLTTLQDGAFMGLETSPISSITLYNNPFYCDCNLQWLKDWLNARNLTESSGARCAFPSDIAFNDINFCPAQLND